MAASLQVVHQVSLAFIQQVVIHGVFFVNRDLLPHHSTADVVALGVNHDNRTGINLEGEIDRVGFRMVCLIGDGNLRQGAVLLLELLAQPLQRTADSGRGEPGPRIQMRDSLHLRRRKAGGSGRLHLPDVSLSPRSDMKQNVHLLRGHVRDAFGGHPRPVVAVFLHQPPDVLHGPL